MVAFAGCPKSPELLRFSGSAGILARKRHVESKVFADWKSALHLVLDQPYNFVERR